MNKQDARVASKPGRKQQLRQALPEGICGNIKVSCGQRHKNKSCNCQGCSYHVRTAGLPFYQQEFLLDYVRS